MVTALFHILLLPGLDQGSAIGNPANAIIGDWTDMAKKLTEAQILRLSQSALYFEAMNHGISIHNRPDMCIRADLHLSFVKLACFLCLAK